MPLEIRELYIKVAVNDGDQLSSTERPADPGQGNQKEEIIQSCVERVLEIIDERRER